MRAIKEVNEAEGKKLVALARQAIQAKLDGKPFSVKGKLPKQGVFVTLKKHDGQLRGCIGFPYPVKPLDEAVADAAASAAFSDNRFPPITKEEFGRTEIEVSVLSVPKLIKVKEPREYPQKIRLGEDGLIIEYGPFSGLLLPQVATEQKWDAEDFLAGLCMKAGLSPDYWLEPGVKIYSFQAQIFNETR